MRRAAAALAVLAATAAPAWAAELDGAALNGASLSWAWALPFAGLLLSIALGPLAFPHLWHRHYGTIALGWSAVTIGAVAATFGGTAALHALAHALLAEYMSFIILLFALFVTAGGILITGTLRGTPLRNTLLLVFGAMLASVVGTTGASMILIRPLLRANGGRRNRAPVAVFFIFLVGNIGGALTPLGDPPLFVGFLRGVDFFWTTQALWRETLFVTALVAAIFFCVDTWFWRRDRDEGPTWSDPVRLRGAINLLLLAGIIGAILAAAGWRSGVTVTLLGTRLALESLARDGALLMLAALSLWLTPQTHRAANGFSFAPIREVAILFAGIFICIVPVLAMLQAGPQGAFAPLIALTTTPDGAPSPLAYFWLTGALSAFLDNAPTYLVFFELAGGDAARLMGPLAGTLAALSMGAVYLGAMTYIGNAPNFMVYAIAKEQGVRMPNFFGYMAWSCAVLLPVFAALSALFLVRL